MKSIEQREEEKKSLIESKWIYRGRVISLKTETHQFEEGQKVFEVVQHPGAVVIIPIDPKGRILLIQQWRRAVKEITIELPAGTLEPDEEPLECAKRELQEETGFAARKMTPLGGFFSAPGFCTEYLHLFLAEDLQSAPLPPDIDEKIDLFPITMQEAKHLIQHNQIRDAKTVAGILRFLCEK